MKKDRKKIFGIGAAILVLLLAVTPVMGGLSLNETVKTNDSDFSERTLEEHERLMADRQFEYRAYAPGMEIDSRDPNVVYYNPGYAIVGLYDQDGVSIIVSLTGSELIDSIYVLPGFILICLFKLSEGMTYEEFYNIVNPLGFVGFCEVDARVTTCYTPNDPLWDDQWGPQAINCPEAWDTTKGSNEVVIAVLDTGFCHTHHDRPASVMWGRDFVEDDWNPQDENGHGTHCAGIAAAQINNNLGIAGVSKSTILVVKVLDEYGGGWTWDIAKAIIWASKNDMGNAWVISMSLGGSLPSVLLGLACDYAYYVKNVLIVAAAGNEGANNPLYPAGYNSVIAVGAVDDDIDRPWWSNGGVELMAPGVDILSLKKGTTDGYIEYDGTSMACPHVAGVVALCLAKLGEKKAYKVRAILDENAIDIGPFDEYGYGLVDAEASVEACPLGVSSKQQQVLNQQSSNEQVVSNPLTSFVLRFLSHAQKIFNFLPYSDNL